MKNKTTKNEGESDLKRLEKQRLKQKTFCEKWNNENGENKILDPKTTYDENENHSIKIYLDDKNKNKLLPSFSTTRSNVWEKNH